MHARTYKFCLFSFLCDCIACSHCEILMLFSATTISTGMQHAVLNFVQHSSTFVSEVRSFLNISLLLLTPSLPQPVKFPG